MVDLLSASGTTIGVNSIRNKVNEIITEGVAGVAVSENPPSSSAEGDLWYDTNLAELYVYLGSPTNSWIQVGGGGGGSGGGGGASVSTDTEAPTNPAEGDLWFNENVGSLFVYISGTGWIETNPGGGGGGARAYVAFDPKGSVSSIYNSYNVTSVTDKYMSSATGGIVRWTVNFETEILDPIVQFSVDSLYSDDTYTEFTSIPHGYHIIDSNTIQLAAVWNFSGGIPPDGLNHWSLVIF